MFAKLTTYIILTLLLYHAFRSFSFKNTSIQPKRAFLFKPTKFLNELPLNSIDIKAQSPIDKYMKHHEIIYFISLSEFVVNYNSNEKDF
jgi:hypothetical protein